MLPAVCWQEVIVRVMMRKVLYIAVLFFIFSCSAALGQVVDSSVPGGFPIVDTLELNQIRSKLAETKRTRPTVALVLSGGGAKGASHVGVIKYIKSLGIPVDVIVGTSMGGLVGGMYALGYNADEMDAMIKTIDWNSALTDNITRDYISYAENKYREKYVLSFPFYYSKEEFMKMRMADEQLVGVDKKYETLHLGTGGDDPNKLVKENLLGSLPAGFIFGQNVSNVLSSLTIGYQDDIKFIDLPIPFICVATEMVTGKAKIWTSGKLNTALRSTMSIPGVFAPVRVDGMVLVDGGMRDNYPTDIARYLDVDFIIGVDLSQGFRGFKDLNNLADIIWQGVDMLGRESYEKNAKETEVTIKPELDGYGMMSFDRASLDTIVARGYEAALSQKDNLMAMKELINNTKDLRGNKKAVDINHNLLSISSVEITGVDERVSKYLMDKIDLDVRKKVGRDEIQTAVATIYGTMAFDYVTYELLGTSEPYRLKINCKKGPLHKIGFGARIDTEEIVSVLLNFGWNAHKLHGTGFDLTGKIGINPYVDFRYYYMDSDGPTFNARTKFHYAGRSRLNWGGTNVTTDYSNLMEEIYFSNISWSKFDLKAGIRNDFYNINSLLTDNIDKVKYNLNTMKNSYVSLFLNARTDTFDRGYFPNKGFTIGIDYGWTFAGLRSKITPFHAIQIDAKAVFGNGGLFSVIPSAYLRFLFSSADIPLPYINVAGGSMIGRYMQQQIPFVGVNDFFAAEDKLFVLRSDFRFKLFKNNYLNAIVNFADTFAEMKDFVNFNNSKRYIGAGIEYAYDSIIGPIKADIHWSNYSNRVGVYLSIGYDF